MKDWNEDIPEEQRRQIEKRAMFSMRYGVKGKTLKQLAAIKPLPRWKRLWLRIVGIRCITCGVTLDDAYWRTRHPFPVAFDSLIRMICEDRRRCMECALAEEKLEREQRDGHSEGQDVSE